MEQTYKAKIHCKNCDLKKEIDIKTGVKVEEANCPNCGTLNIEKNTDIIYGY